MISVVKYSDIICFESFECNGRILYSGFDEKERLYYYTRNFNDEVIIIFLDSPTGNDRYIDTYIVGYFPDWINFKIWKIYGMHSKYLYTYLGSFAELEDIVIKTLERAKNIVTKITY